MNDTVNNFFYKDDVTKDVSSISVGTVWLYFYREALVAASHVDMQTGFEAVMVKEFGLPRIAYSAYREWISLMDSEVPQRIADDLSMLLSDFKPVLPEDIQNTALRWIADQISQIVTTRLVGSD